MIVKYKLLKPKTNDPEEKLRFRCSVCGDELGSGELDKHALASHNGRTIYVDSTMASFGNRTEGITKAELSKLLFNARESCSILANIVELQSNKVDNYNKKIVADIDKFRAAQGWNKDGYGGEGNEKVELI